MTKRVQLFAALVVALLILAGVSELVRLRRRAVVSRESSSAAVPAGTMSPAASSDEAEHERRRKLLALPIADATAYAELHSARRTMADDLRIVSGLVQNYLGSLAPTTSGPPLGFNEDVVRALAGENPLGVAFLPANHSAIDARGRLCDRWGTPYFFHPLSASLIEVRSAGPDRKLFTADDGVLAPVGARPAGE